MKYSLTLLLLFATSAYGKTWQVGPTRQYTVPSAVMSLVADGDTVLIDSGMYVGDVGVWNNNNLVIRCPNGMARFNANGNIAQQKGIWVVYGKNTYMEGFEFFGAAISLANGDNGAGIRVQGNGFTCRRCYFHDNQEGILTGNDTTNNDIWIEACEFDHNGVEGTAAAGYEHNIYVGLCSTCTIKFCYFHSSIVGHELKCRANKSYILYNKIVDGATGDGSLSIDIPQGGLAFVIGNSIEKGPMTANSTVIGYGEEGLKNPDTDFYFINNTIVTDRNPTTFFEIAAGTKTALIANNIFAGTGHPITGFADTEANVFNADTSFFHFADPSNCDYHITQSFQGYTSAVNPGSEDGFSLIPYSGYLDPEDSVSELFLSVVGAFQQNTVALFNDSIWVIKPFDSITCIGETDTLILGAHCISGPAHQFGELIYDSSASGAYRLSNTSEYLSPGTTCTLRVFFTPNSIQPAIARLVLDADTGIILRAVGGAAQISGHDTISAPLGITSNFSLLICNTGTCSWTPGYALFPNPRFSYIAGGQNPIQQGGCDTVEFNVTPDSDGLFTTWVAFPSSSGTSIPLQDVTITMHVLSSGVTELLGTSRLHTNFPNPFSSETLIPNITGSLKLYNVCGNDVKATTIETENGIVIERGNLPVGIYFYRISQAERGTIAEGSVVIGE